MKHLLLLLLLVSSPWTGLRVQAQIAVGCFQGQPDSSVGADSKTYQDIYMSQGACTNFCKSNGSAYALTLDGSTCRCSNTPPQDANKVEDSKCDKPCMGYPFEMCGGSSSNVLANVLLIGSSAAPPPPSANNGGSSNPGSEGSDSSKNGNNTTQPANNKEKVLNANTSEESSTSSGGGAGAGAIAASIMAVFGFALLFAVAMVLSKRRRQRRAQAAWTENMLLPSSLVHCSEDERSSHDYSRSAPLYRSNSVSQHGSVPSPPANVHYPPPPVLHPRQGGTTHMQQPSYPPPLLASHYNMRGGQYQPYPMPSMTTQQPYEQNHYHSLNHKEPVSASPPPFNRGPQALQHPSAAGEDDHERLERSFSHQSTRSMRPIRRDSIQRDSLDSCASGMRVMNPDSRFYGPDS
ncbi:hypothetical protein KVV02_004408 [Mortierella alpina]|uniref:WSC domain-containing protein n=1 Tax=Mortierella alpina TaxID=64518 RepID=A0A9P7ZYF9_MORAP|nr:hypothetical protein KVV02_004408 [Mortierella alpina]